MMSEDYQSLSVELEAAGGTAGGEPANPRDPAATFRR